MVLKKGLPTKLTIKKKHFKVVLFKIDPTSVKQHQKGF